MKLGQWSLSNKYRSILVAISVFVVIDLAVLISNFYISFQLDQDAIVLNISGRQRVTSQRIARILLELESDRLAGKSPDLGLLDELRKAADIFNTSQLALRDGGAVLGGDGIPVSIDATESARGRMLLEQGLTIWDPLFTKLKPILSRNDFGDEALADALSYSRTNSAKLLKAANDYVTDVQNEATARASRLRLIQLIGIVLALLNFAFTVFQSMRQLIAGDRQVDKAQRETKDILRTVKEGLLLLEPDGKIGSQTSESLEKIVGRKIRPGMEFRELIAPMLDAQMQQAAQDYIQLLFANRVKENLVTSINPLSEIEAKNYDRHGVEHVRYLNFTFNRVVEEGAVQHLLVTIQDATERVSLMNQLDQAKLRAREELDVMLRMLTTDPWSLQNFVHATEQRLAQVNERLRSASSSASSGEDTQWLVNTMFRSIHAIKGDAAALGLELFEKLAHQFEVQLVRLRESASMDGDDLIALMLQLDDFLERVSQVRKFVQRQLPAPPAAAVVNEAPARPSDATQFVDSLGKLANRIAAEQGKDVRVVGDCALLDQLPPQRSAPLRDIAVQFVRNAVVHGIETIDERQQAGKSISGTIDLSLKMNSNQSIEFSVRDDGRGLNVQRIRDALIRSGRMRAEQISALDDRQVIMKIFEPGVSTREQADGHAGHGVGLDLVREKATAAGGRIGISSRVGQYTEFRVTFARQLPSTLAA